jgi:signal transduction histidine kinase
MQSAVKKWKSVPLRRDERFDTYFHTLSHDLRTPLNHITGFAELLNLDEGLAVAQKEYAEAIMAACGELNNAVLAHLQLIENSLRGDEPVDAAASPDDQPQQP